MRVAMVVLAVMLGLLSKPTEAEQFQDAVRSIVAYARENDDRFNTDRLLVVVEGVGEQRRLELYGAVVYYSVDQVPIGLCRIDYYVALDASSTLQWVYRCTLIAGVVRWFIRTVLKNYVDDYIAAASAGPILNSVLSWMRTHRSQNI